MGIQSPDTLAPAFDDMELGLALSARMLACVTRDIRRWLDAGLPVGRVSLNASPADFRRDDYAERTLEHLRVAGIPPSCFGLEIIETVFLDHNAENVRKTLRTLSEGGISVALDDFGTGYASLSHLKQFPVERHQDRPLVCERRRNRCGKCRNRQGDAEPWTKCRNQSGCRRH